MPNVALQESYIRTGVILDRDKMTVDLSQPRTMLVRGINARTGETKDYLLKVTQSGKLILI